MKKVCYVMLGILGFSMGMLSFECKGATREREYVVQAQNSSDYQKLKKEAKSKRNIVVQVEENESYLAQMNVVTMSLSEDEAEELKNDKSLKVEPNFKVSGCNSDIEYPMPELLDIPEETREEYTENPEEFIPRKEVKKKEERDEIVPWNICCVAGEPHENKYKGKKVKVAIMDSGIDIHDNLATKKWVDFSDKVKGYKPIDNNGHGTAVAGPIGGRISGFGFEGIASEADIYSVKVLDKENQASISNIVKAIQWCIENDVDIINMSFGMDNSSQVLKEAIKKAYEADILMIAAAGNNSERVQYPAKYDEVLSVGSINQQLQDSSFSKNDEVDLVAPGECVQTTAFLGGYAIEEGTSMAASHVTGVAAAVKSARKKMTVAELKSILMKGAIKLQSGSKLVQYTNTLRKTVVDDAEISDIDEITLDEVKEILDENDSFVKGSWSKDAWNGLSVSGHKTMINEIPLGYFAGNTVTEQKRYQGITADAAFYTDAAEYMMAEKKGNAERDGNGYIIENSTKKMYSPYHAKSEYSLSEVSCHLLFLYELARRRIVLDSPLDLSPLNYSGNTYYSISISQKQKRRIIVDLARLREELSQKEIRSTKDYGYMVLGVFLHLVQDIQAHRARFTANMLYVAPYNVYHTEDTFTASPSGSRINSNNIADANKKNALYNMIQYRGAIPMIELKKYLKSGKFKINCAGAVREVEAAQAYEDNPYFFSLRFSTAKSYSMQYMKDMLNDKGNTTTKTTYYVASSVSLI